MNSPAGCTKPGNVTDLDLANERAAYGEQLELAQAEADVLETRERLNARMGLWGRRPGAGGRVSAAGFA